MLALVYPMGTILLAWLLLALLFSGLGLLVIRLMRRDSDAGIGMHECFWLGWAASLGILQIWHLFQPVNDLALVLLSMTALASWISRRATLLSFLRCLPRSRVFLAIGALSLLWMANRAMEMPDETDTGLREMQAVMWLDAYPIVPGLNNLHASLAYNHSSYLYDALLDAGHFEGRAWYIATGLLVVVSLAYALRGAYALIEARDANQIRWSQFFAALTIPYLFFYTIGRGGLSHFLTDTAVDLVGFITLIYLLDFLQDIKRDGKADAYHFLRLVIIICAGFTIKQTYWVFGLGVGLLALGVWIMRLGWKDERGRLARNTLIAIALALAFMLPWMLRGVITSGYIAYPQLLGRVDVDWAEPVDMVRERQRQLATNTRRRHYSPEVVLASWDWLGPWLEKLAANTATFSLPAAISAASLLLYALGCRRGSGAKSRHRPSMFILLPLAAMLIFWFFSLPNFKYVRYIVWSWAALCALMAALVWEDIAWRIRVALIYAGLCLCLAYGGGLVIAGRHFPLPAGPDDGFYAHHIPPIKVFVTDSGLRLNTPNSHILQCWAIPLPCTPSPRRGIYLRAPGEMRHGFGYEPTAD